MHTTVASTITVAIVPLTAETDGDVTERRDLRHCTRAGIGFAAYARTTNPAAKGCEKHGSTFPR